MTDAAKMHAEALQQRKDEVDRKVSKWRKKKRVREYHKYQSAQHEDGFDNFCKQEKAYYGRRDGPG